MTPVDTPDDKTIVVTPPPKPDAKAPEPKPTDATPAPDFETQYKARLKADHGIEDPGELTRIRERASRADELESFIQRAQPPPDHGDLRDGAVKDRGGVLEVAGPQVVGPAGLEGGKELEFAVEQCTAQARRRDRR